MSITKIAITGSSGLIGSHLLAEFRTRSYETYLLSRQESTQECLHSIRWVPEKGVLDPGQLEGMDAIIHLAGKSIASRRWTQAEKRRLIDSRVLATQILANQIASLRHKPKLFLSASAIGVYGDQDDVVATEETGAGTDFLAQLGVQWEAASQMLTQHEVRVVHARFGIVLSTSGGALAQMLPLFRWGLGGRLGSGKQYWSWISLTDCIRALLHLMDRDDLTGAFNIVSPQPITNQQFTRVLASALHRPALLPAPGFALRLLLGEMADALLLSNCAVLPERLIRSGFTYQHAALDQFLKEELAAK